MTSKTRSALRTAVLILLLVSAIPQTRGILVAQISQFVRIFSRQSWLISPSGLVLFDPQQFFTMGTEPRHAPHDVIGTLAAAERKAFMNSGSETERMKAYSDAIKRYPDYPAFYAGQLRYLVIKDPFKEQGIQTAEQAERIRMMEQAVENGKRLEPQNSYFDLFEAYIKFEQGKNEEGLAAIHRAASKRRYEPHTSETALALLTSDDIPSVLKWMSPDRRVRIYFSGSLPHLARFRDAAKSAAGASAQGLKAGNPKAAESMLELVRIGATMGRESRDVISVLVGQAIMVKGIDALLPQARIPQGKWPTNMEELDAALAKLGPLDRGSLTSAQWGFIRSNVAHSADVSARIKNFVKTSSGISGILTVAVQLALWNLSVRMLLQSALLMLIGFASYEWLRKRGLSGTQCSSPGSLTVWLLAVIPPALALGLGGFLWGVKVWSMDTIGVNSAPGAGVLVLMNVLTPILVVVTALVGARIFSSESHSMSESFVARLQRASVIAAKALLVVYCVAMIACVSLTARANRQIDRLTDNEVRMMLEPRINDR